MFQRNELNKNLLSFILILSSWYQSSRSREPCFRISSFLSLLLFLLALSEVQLFLLIIGLPEVLPNCGFVTAAAPSLLYFRRYCIVAVVVAASSLSSLLHRRCRRCSITAVVTVPSQLLSYCCRQAIVTQLPLLESSLSQPLPLPHLEPFSIVLF